MQQLKSRETTDDVAGLTSESIVQIGVLDVFIYFHRTLTIFFSFNYKNKKQIFVKFEFVLPLPYCTNGC